MHSFATDTLALPTPFLRALPLTIANLAPQNAQNLEDLLRQKKSISR